MLRDVEPGDVWGGKMQTVTAPTPDKDLNIYWSGPKLNIDSEAIAEVSTLTPAGAFAALTAGHYFDLYSVKRGYRFWAKKDGVGTAPADGGLTLVAIPFVTADSTVTLVCDRIRTALNAIGDFTATGTVTVVITNKLGGAVTDAAVSGASWTSVTVGTQGVNKTVLFDGVPLNDGFEIFDVTVEDASGAADVTIWYRADDITLSAKGLRNDTFTNKRVVKTGLVTL